MFYTPHQLELVSTYIILQTRSSFKPSKNKPQVQYMFQVSFGKKEHIILKNKCELIKALVSTLPIVKPDTKPPPTTLSNILLKTSITLTKCKGDRRLPCWSPLELSKKPQGLPLIRIEERRIEMQNEIQFLHFSKKSRLRNKQIGNPQLT